MPWRLEADEEPGLIRVVYSGGVTKADIEAATAKALTMVREAGPARFLTEFENAEVRLTTLEIWSIFEQWQELGANRRNKLAVVVPVSSPLRDDAKFHETVCLNRGWQVRTFPERQDAIDWLTGKASANTR